MDQFINTIIWAAIFQGIVLGILYLFSKKHNSFANKLLGLFMFALVMEPIDSFLTVDYILGYANQGYFALPEVKILLPIFFLHFVLEKLGSSKRFIVFFKIHYGLAFIVIGITLLNILFHVFSGTTIHDHFTFRQIENVFYVQQYYAFVLTVVALITSVRETMKYRRLVLNEYSDITMLEINWLWQFILLIFPVSILWGTQLLIILLNGSGDTDLQLVIWAFVILFIYFSTYKAFQHKNLIEESDPKPIPLEDNLDQTDRKNESGDFGQELTENMQENRYYLNQDLTIYDLAKEMSIPPRLVSSTINQQLGYNFSEWVNGFRVDRAQDMLQDSSNSHLSIEGIGIDSGFKSRSAMYTAFKKKTGQTPGYFKES